MPVLTEAEVTTVMSITLSVRALAAPLVALGLMAGASPVPAQNPSTPGTFTSATFTFQASEKKGTGADWKSIYDEVGTEISIPTVTSDDYHVVPAIWFAGVNFLQITSSASQGADATVTLHLVPVS